MLNTLKSLQNIGEGLRGAIRFDLEYTPDAYYFFLQKNKKDNTLKTLITKSLNRKITHDDQL